MEVTVIFTGPTNPQRRGMVQGVTTWGENIRCHPRILPTVRVRVLCLDKPVSLAIPMSSQSSVILYSPMKGDKNSTTDLSSLGDLRKDVFMLVFNLLL